MKMVSVVSDSKMQPGHGHINRAETPVINNSIAVNLIYVLQISALGV